MFVCHSLAYCILLLGLYSFIKRYDRAPTAHQLGLLRVDYYYIRSYDHNRDTVYGQPDEQMYFYQFAG